MCPESAAPEKILSFIKEKQVVAGNDIARAFNLKPITVKNYLSRLARIGEVKSVGGGLYQVGNGERVTMKAGAALTSVTKKLQEAFPVTEFAVWSLQMLSDYSHYMIGRDIMFVETSKMLSASVRDELVSKGYRAVLQPERRDFREFASYKEAPIFILERKERYGLVKVEGILVPTPERVWADIYYLSTRKDLAFDPFELGLIFAAMVDRGGVNFDLLLRYSDRRGIFREVLIFLYELMKTNSDAGKKIVEHAILGRRGTLDTIAAMVEGGKKA